MILDLVSLSWLAVVDAIRQRSPMLEIKITHMSTRGIPRVHIFVFFYILGSYCCALHLSESAVLDRILSKEPLIKPQVVKGEEYCLQPIN
jgi:hypothetical protein